MRRREGGSRGLAGEAQAQEQTRPSVPPNQPGPKRPRDPSIAEQGVGGVGFHVGRTGAPWFICPLSSPSPHPWSPAWDPARTERSPDRRVSGDLSAHSARGATVLDSCTNLCPPLYICYIECIYVGNLLASPVCRRCASCSPQHGALVGEGATAMPPAQRSHHRPKPVPAVPSACQSVSSALSTLR